MSFGEKAITLTELLGRKPNLETATDIMQWELGDLVKAVTYMRWHPELKSTYEVEARKAVADLVFQSAVVGKLLGMELNELFELGANTVSERAVDLLKQSGRFQAYVGEPDPEQYAKSEAKRKEQGEKYHAGE